jgi:hypothetical protein
MKEDYILALRSGDKLLQNVGAPPASKEERYDVVTRIEKMLHLSGQTDPEINEIRESYIARGISALDSAGKS